MLQHAGTGCASVGGRVTRALHARWSSLGGRRPHSSTTVASAVTSAGDDGSIIVSGAGLAGLCFALFVKRMNPALTVDVIDLNPAIQARDEGDGMLLTPNASRLLTDAQVGIPHLASATGATEVNRLHIYSQDSRRSLLGAGGFDIGALSASPTLALSWHRLQRALLAEVKQHGVTHSMDQRCRSPFTWRRLGRTPRCLLHHAGGIAGGAYC